MTAATRHVCSYPVQPRDEDGNPQDRTRCLIPGCDIPRGRTVPVDEALLRSALRDALAFAQALENSGDTDATEFVREYELALIQLADAPDADSAASERDADYSRLLGVMPKVIADLLWLSKAGREGWAPGLIEVRGRASAALDALASAEVSA